MISELITKERYDALASEMEQLTKELVSVASVNTTPGEKKIGEKIEDYIRNIEYFKNHPENVYIQELQNDSYERRNVIALLKGEKDDNRKTLIWHGHTDTVGVEDFKELQEWAFDCDKLQEKMKTSKLPDEVRQDLDTGDYLFGRGACDMKGGDAVFLVLLKEMSSHVKELSGNILVSFNPVEENLHTGIVEATGLLQKIKEEHALEFTMAINNDYICPLYPGDNNRYIYMGTVGKLLPCFYIQGKETHVGQCFEGFDASLAASLLVKNVTLNTELCNQYKEEYTLPPSVLKVKDLKNEYNVQTAFNSYVYFNYFVHDEEFEDTLEKFVKIGQKTMQEVLDIINTQYKLYCNLTHDDYKKISYDTKVLTYEELTMRVEKECGSEKLMQIKDKTQVLLEDGTDKREIGMILIKEMLAAVGEHNPVMVLYFAPPYCPHNTLKKENPKEHELYEKIEATVNVYSEECGEPYKILQFFPSLSDSSYLKIDDSDSSIKKLKNNFAEVEKLYNIPFDAIRELNIPAINYGCYGKDAHKWSERLYKPYSFGVLPGLIVKTIDNILMK